MALWHSLARTYRGEELIRQVANALRARVPSARDDDEHYRRRALAVLRQAGINPFHPRPVTPRGAVTEGPCAGALAGPTSQVSPGPLPVAREPQTDNGAAPTSIFQPIHG